MNEVENHYAGQSGAAGGRRKGGSRGKQPFGRGSSSGLQEQAGEALDSATEWGRERYEDATAWASDAYGSASRRASEAGRKSAGELDRTRRAVTDFVEENPIMVGVVGLAAGLLIGSLLPGTRRENKAFGRYADEARQQGKRYARDLAEQGKQLVEESLPRGRTGRDTGDETRAA